MSRLKLFLAILIIAAISIVLVQNREPLALKLLCADDASCVYQTPQLPLALWIVIFILLGAIANLIGQALNRYSYANGKQKPPLDDELYASDRNWNRGSKIEDPIIRDKFSDTASYEVKQEPQNIERSGSTYSYKYREASDRPKEDLNHNRDRSVKPETNPEGDRDDDEDWI